MHEPPDLQCSQQAAAAAGEAAKAAAEALGSEERDAAE